MCMLPTQYPVWDLFGCLFLQFSESVVCCLVSDPPILLLPLYYLFSTSGSYGSILSQCLGLTSRRIEREEKHQRLALPYWDCCFSDWRGRLPCCHIKFVSGWYTWEQKKGKEKKIGCFRILSWVFKNPFPILQARTKLRFPLALSVHISVCFQVLGCSLSTPRDTARKRNAKLTLDSVILWILVFFLSPPATVYFSESSNSCS